MEEEKWNYLPSSYQRISPGLGPFSVFRNVIRFYSEDFLAPRPNPKLKDYPLSAVRYCLVNIFAATLHPEREIVPCLGDRDPSTRITESEMLGKRLT